MRRVIIIAVWAAGFSPAGVQAQTETVTYYHTDAIGSVRMVTNEAAQVVARYDYQPFGLLLDQNPAPPPEPRQFAGKERDAETGFDYFGGRYYASQTGRFTTVDPGHVNGDIFDPQSWNAYAYARNNPLKYTDPTGTEYEICAEGAPSCQRVSDQYFGVPMAESWCGHSAFRGLHLRGWKGRRNLSADEHRLDVQRLLPTDRRESRCHAQGRRDGDGEERRDHRGDSWCRFSGQGKCRGDACIALVSGIQDRPLCLALAGCWRQCRSSGGDSTGADQERCTTAWDGPGRRGPIRIPSHAASRWPHQCRDDLSATMTRPLTRQERELIDRIAERLDERQRRQLLDDAAVATAEAVNDDGSIIRFYLEGYERPPYRGQHAVPVEGVVEDADGASITVLLHQDENDRLYELEFVRYDDGDLMAPKWDTLKLT